MLPAGTHKQPAIALHTKPKAHIQRHRFRVSSATQAHKRRRQTELESSYSYIPLPWFR